MEKHTKRCTSSLEKALEYVEEFFHERVYLELAKQITEYVFSLDNPLNNHSFSIKCYVTKIPDIRFCIDRGSDCEKKITMTNFLCIRPPCAIHVIAEGNDYLKVQNNTKFCIISTDNVLKLGIPKIKEHILESFCFRIKEYKLTTVLCK
uniref:Uncharacterized protein n=1 Tax=Desulfobacca acetoxidans TaxID=60893 RepID=A0A7V4G8E0_9BACT